MRVRNIKGQFVSNNTIIGADSGGAFTIDAPGDSPLNDASSIYDDNILLENEAQNVLDFTESNPFGEPS